MHVAHMSKMIQIRHVPDRLHRRLKARAAAAGLPLSDYLRRELERVGDQLTPDELRDALDRLDAVTTTETAAAAVRAERDTQ
jgi:plasmid stability protein